jgi:hypothetical protein
MYGLHRTKQDIEEVAEAKCLVCIFPEDDELTLDIDRPFKREELNVRVIETLENNGVHVVSMIETKSKSGNKHVWIKLDTQMPVEARIALQAVLGSDPIRETLSMLRYLAKSEAALAMFETFKGAEQVKLWREAFKAELARVDEEFWGLD